MTRTKEPPRDDADARVLLETVRWPRGVRCPGCGSGRVTARRGRRAGEFRCRACVTDFTVRTGTPLAHSRAGHAQWLRAIAAMPGDPAGVTVFGQLVGVSRPTARYMLARLRPALGDVPARATLRQRCARLFRASASPTDQQGNQGGNP